MSVVLEFGAAPGAGFSDEEADLYGRFLEENGAGEKPLPTEQIVELARPKRSPIHGRVFDCDDQQAAYEYRCERARHLVRHIVRHRTLDTGETVRTKAFHHVKTKIKHSDHDEDASGYVAERVVWSSSDWSNQIIGKAFKELRLWRDRYSQYSLLSAQVAKVTEILDEAS